MLTIAGFVSLICVSHVIRMMETVTRTLSSLEGKRKKRVSFGSESVKYFDKKDTPKSIKVIVEIVGHIGQVQSPSTWVRILDWFALVLDSFPDMSRIFNFSEILEPFEPEF